MTTAAFAYSDLLPTGPDETPYRLITDEGVSTIDTPAGRLGTPRDTADLVRFLFSEAGGWINGQLLHSNGGFKTS